MTITNTEALLRIVYSNPMIYQCLKYNTFTKNIVSDNRSTFIPTDTRKVKRFLPHFPIVFLMNKY